jgi:DMSO/TMAO reductase YedYZ molybdopterin-dependent catalytic subunit
LLEHVILKPEARYVMAYSYGGYSTNVPLADLRNGKAFIGLHYEGLPLAPEHGGPARLVVPICIFGKVPNGSRAYGLWKPMSRVSGAWGYSMYGDPWKEQRYRTDDE